jgi:CDP-glucose 4,6-dehydratase
MRCLITGADGFLGANLAKRLIAAGHEVTATALNRKGQTSLDALNINCRVEYGDVTDAKFVERVINAYESEWVFHLAAVSIVRIASDRPVRALTTNIMGTLNVLEACSQTDTVKAVLVASSDKAYGDNGGRPYVEDMPLMPTGAYEVSKASADMITRLYGSQYEVPAMVVRCANLFGPADLNWSRIIPNSCRRALQGLAPEVHGGAWNYRREYISVETAADAYIHIAEHGVPGEAYNVGSGNSWGTGELATKIATIMAAPLPVEQPHEGYYEIPTQSLDRGKLKDLGFRLPGHDPMDDLQDTVFWYQRHLWQTLINRVTVNA